MDGKSACSCHDLSTSIPRSLAIAVSVMLSIFILALTFGNALVCNRLRSHRELHKVPHYLLASLSLTGLTWLFSMPSFLIRAAIVNSRQASLLPVPERVSRKLRPQKLRPQTSDPENSDPSISLKKRFTFSLKTIYIVSILYHLIIYGHAMFIGNRQKEAIYFLYLLRFIAVALIKQ